MPLSISVAQVNSSYQPAQQLTTSADEEPYTNSATGTNNGDDDESVDKASMSNHLSYFLLGFGMISGPPRTPRRLSFLPSIIGRHITLKHVVERTPSSIPVRTLALLHSTPAKCEIIGPIALDPTGSSGGRTSVASSFGSVESNESSAISRSAGSSRNSDRPSRLPILAFCRR
ncbi:unnamed protein product [Tilletia controversa]|nr:unnamed protein product [Tilletia controversa]